MDHNPLTRFARFAGLAAFARVGLLLAALLLSSCRSYPAGRSEEPITQGEIRALPREDGYFLEVENYALEYRNFDWRLNDASRGY